MTTTISGTAGKTIGGTFANFGTIPWTGGNILLGGAASISNAGTFDIRGNDRIVAAGVSITNAGVFKKALETGTTTIDAMFINSGQFLLQSGVVKFNSSAGHVGPAQQGSGGLTRLNGGSLETTSTYYVASGLLEGVGTITGNVSTDDPADPGAGAGEIKPGLGTAPGTLNIDGDLTLSPSGALSIYISATGTIGTLRVQQSQGQGGVAFLAGLLYVHRDPAYTPLKDTTLTFLQYLHAEDDFDTFTFINNSWSSGGLNNLYFDAEKMATLYRLIVKQGVVPGGGGEGE